MTPNLLDVKNLKTTFLRNENWLAAVDGISFTINKGETLVLVGESGCGKSITSLSIMGLLPDNGRLAEGEILFNGQDLSTKTEAQMSVIRGNNIAMIFQEPMTSLNPVLTIGEQIQEGILLHKKINRQEARKQVIEILTLVGFPQPTKVLNEYPHQLSGGMRQRVMIAMAIATYPQLLIADEPTTALDVTIQAQILELMQDLKERLKMSILLITHDIGVVAEMADRVAVMYAGKIVEEAEVRDLFNNPSHPYTEGLMKAVPSLETDQKRLYSIPGNVPTLDELHQGCRFAKRCPRAWELCFESEPELETISPGHTVRCFLYTKQKENVQHDSSTA